MGVVSSSNLELFLPHKHPLVRPAMEDHELRPKRRQLVQDHDDQEIKQHNDVAVPLGLKIMIPSYNTKEKDDDSNDGFKTPTSPEHKIPAILQYPPAPRKPKSRPSMKRKGCRPQLLLDLSQEIESFFSTPFAVDLGGCGKNKKVKLLTN